MQPDRISPDKHPLPFIIFLFITSFICGSLVMVVEVLGSRVIGPFFGASLFVWTSLITVTLTGLALGYMAGGLLSDRRDSPDYLYGIIFIAGIAVMLIPVLKKPVLEISLDLGLRAGALTASALLFGPALFLLGCVSPYIIKIAAVQIRTIGRTVGLFYAVSTVGSFIGTICTGFIFIAYFRVNQIFIFVGVLLILLSITYLTFFRRRPLALLLLAVPFIIPGPKEVQSKVLDNGTTVIKVYDSDSFHGNIKVLDYVYQEKHLREILVDGVLQGGIDMTSGMSVFNYNYYLQYIPYILNPNGKECLVIGLGAGVVPLWYEQMGIRTDIVEISPEMIAVAEKFFGYRSKGEKIVEDARYYLNRSSKKYDFIVFDVSSGETLPTHVMSLESLRLVAGRMNTDGILALNLLGSLKQNTFMTASVIKTLKEVFKTVEVFPAFEWQNGDGIGNVVLIAHNSPPIPLAKARLRGFPFHYMAASAREQIGNAFTFPADTPAEILTDNYNPIDFFDLKVKEENRKRSIAWTDREMLM